MEKHPKYERTALFRCQDSHRSIGCPTLAPDIVQRSALQSLKPAACTSPSPLPLSVNMAEYPALESDRYGGFTAIGSSVWGTPLLRTATDGPDDDFGFMQPGPDFR